jgi:two-component system cell cycle sensor histidine kinase/response regulator CckA
MGSARLAAARESGFPKPDATPARLAELVWRSADGVLRLSAWDAAAHDWGVAAAEMRGMTPDDLLDVAPEIAAGLLEALRDETSLGVDGTYRTRLGDELLEVAATLVFAPPATVTVHLRDVTEHRAEEREWRASGARFRGAFECSPLGTALVSIDPADAGTVVEVNDAFCGLFGRDRADLVGRVLPAELGHPEDLTTGIEGVTRLVAGEVDSCYFEKRFVRGDASVVVCAVWVSLVGGEHGVPRLALCHFQDLTLRRRAEAKLEEGQREFRDAFSMALDAMVIIDDDRRVTHGNRAAAELFGLEPRELTGRRVEDFYVGPLSPIESWRQFLAAGELKGEFEMRRLDGEMRTVEFSSRAHFMPGRHLSILHDVTARTRAERDRARLEAALHQYQKLETVGQLAGGVAHDFNNLLAVILNACEFAIEDMADQPAREEVLAIQAAAKRAATLTRQLMVFSRQEVVKPQALDLNALVSSIEWVLRRTIGENILLEWELDPGRPVVHADPNHLEQVLLNLAVNARDSMPEGGTLRVATGTVPLDESYAGLHGDLEPGSYVRVSVSDTGCGMTEQVRQRALDPFFTTKPKGSGTGLGLAMAYGIAKQHGGHLEVSSQPEAGTMVSLYLPALEGPGAVLPDDSRRRPARRGVGESVLVVEDDSAVRRIAERILRGAGYRVVSSANAAEALDAVADADLVLTDVVMPGMSGAALVRRLRERVPGLPAIFMSGYTDRPNEIPSSDVFLQKPFSRAALLQQVGRVLGGQDEER